MPFDFLLIVFSLAAGADASARGTDPRPLGHRLVERTHSLHGADRWPDQVFFVWPVLADGPPCPSAWVVVREGTAVRDGVTRCEWLQRHVYPEASCEPCRAQLYAREPPPDEPFAFLAEDATPSSSPRAWPPVWVDGKQVDCNRCNEAVRLEAVLGVPRLMTMSRAAFAALDPTRLGPDEVPAGAVVADRPLVPPRWALAADPVLDEREDDAIVWDGKTLTLRPQAITYGYADRQLETRAAGPGGQLPPPARALPERPAVPYSLVFENPQELAGWTLYLPTSEALVDDTYVQQRLVAIRAGEPIPVLLRQRLPALVAWPSRLGPLPADAFVTIRALDASAIGLRSTTRGALEGAEFGLFLVRLQPPQGWPDVAAVTDVVRVERRAGDSLSADGPILGVRLRATYRYAVGLQTTVPFAVVASPEVDLDAPLQPELVPEEPATRGAKKSARPVRDTPALDLARPAPPQLWQVAARRAGAVLLGAGALAAVVWLVLRSRRRRGG